MPLRDLLDLLKRQLSSYEFWWDLTVFVAFWALLYACWVLLVLVSPEIWMP